MIIGVVFKDGKEIDRGVCVGGKHWNKEYPEQNISIITDNSSIENERKYTHGDGISFQELQNNDGWEVVYDSNEGIDKTIEYPLPNWFINVNRSIR